jgi:hypothetical protein
MAMPTPVTHNLSGETYISNFAYGWDQEAELNSTVAVWRPILNINPTSEHTQL